jgi:hypothetical protein
VKKMQPSDYDDFTNIIQVVGEQYGKKLSGGVIALYWQGLQDFDLAAVRDALGRHLRNTDTGQFMPKIADIIRMLQGSSQDAAYSAWSKVDKAVRRVGPYDTVIFDDPIIHRVLHDMGGWIGLCDKTDDDWPFVAKEFETRYRGFKSRNERVEYPAKMIGIFEAHNAKEGYKVAAPMLIGDASKAQEVMRLGTTGSKMLGMIRLEVEDTAVNLRVMEKSAAGAESARTYGYASF